MRGVHLLSGEKLVMVSGAVNSPSSCTVPEKCHVKLEVYDLRGQRIKCLVDREQENGAHSIIWDGKNDQNMLVNSGVYFYHLKTGEVRHSKKLLILR